MKLSVEQNYDRKRQEETQIIRGLRPVEKDHPHAVLLHGDGLFDDIEILTNLRYAAWVLVSGL